MSVQAGQRPQSDWKKRSGSVAKGCWQRPHRRSVVWVSIGNTRSPPKRTGAHLPNLGNVRLHHMGLIPIGAVSGFPPPVVPLDLSFTPDVRRPTYVGQMDGPAMGVSASPERPPEMALPDAGVRVVVIDNLHDRRQVVTHILELGPPGTSVVGFADGVESALETVGQLSPDAVLLEIQLPVAAGLEVVRTLREAHPALWIVVCSFHASVSVRRAASDLGADLYLAKPVSPRDLSRALMASRAERTVTAS
jgi:CheY-like chemotaxis protein